MKKNSSHCIASGEIYRLLQVYLLIITKSILTDATIGAEKYKSIEYKLYLLAGLMVTWFKC